MLIKIMYYFDCCSHCQLHRPQLRSNELVCLHTAIKKNYRTRRRCANKKCFSWCQMMMRNVNGSECRRSVTTFALASLSSSLHTVRCCAPHREQKCERRKTKHILAQWRKKATTNRQHGASRRLRLFLFIYVILSLSLHYPYFSRLFWM